MKLKRLVLFVILAALISGCAAKSPFVYDKPIDIPEPNQGVIVAVIAPLTDLREDDDKEIDKIYAKQPLEDIQEILLKELMSTGIFKEIIFSPTDDGNITADINIEPSLVEMRWEVPNYDDILNKAFLTSMLTGGIGGAIYGSTKTDVYGDTSLYIKIVQYPTEEIIIEKQYDGHCEEKVAKLSCDTPETKARMVGLSLEKALETLKVELTEKFSKQKEYTISPQLN